MEAERQSELLGSRERTSIVDVDLLDELGEREGIVTGVVKISEICEDRRRTLLTIEVGEADHLVVLVKGGADSFVGRIVILDGPQRLIFCADERHLAFSVPNTLSAPQAFIEAGIDLPELLDSSGVKRIRAAVEPSEFDGLSEKQRSALAKYKTVGVGGSWKLPALLQLVAVLKGRDKDSVSHLAAVMILEKAEKHGDCSPAADLAALLTSSRRKGLRTWFAKFSPIALDISGSLPKARFYKPGQGKRNAFDVAKARTILFMRSLGPRSLTVELARNIYLK